MLSDFILAVALICPSVNEVAVKEVLTAKPIPYVECDQMAHDQKIKEDYLPRFEGKEGCDLDLICVRVLWTD